MKQRVKEFGGELRLKNKKPGTLVEVVIPHKAADMRFPAVQLTSSPEITR